MFILFHFTLLTRAASIREFQMRDLERYSISAVCENRRTADFVILEINIFYKIKPKVITLARDKLELYLEGLF